MFIYLRGDFFFKNLLLELYNVVLLLYNKVNQLYLYICLLPFESPSHPAPLLPLLGITEHQTELPVLYNSFPLATYFIHGGTQSSEKAMAPHSSTLAWKIPWTGEPGGLQSMRSLGVGHDPATSLSLFTFMHWRRKWQPTPVFLPGESQGRGAWWAAVYGVAQSRTRLK